MNSNGVIVDNQVASCGKHHGCCVRSGTPEPLLISSRESARITNRVEAYPQEVLQDPTFIRCTHLTADVAGIAGIWFYASELFFGGDGSDVLFIHIDFRIRYCSTNGRTIGAVDISLVVHHEQVIRRRLPYMVRSL